MKTKLALLGLLPVIATAQPADDTTLYAYKEQVLFDGKYGPVR